MGGGGGAAVLGKDSGSSSEVAAGAVPVHVPVLLRSGAAELPPHQWLLRQGFTPPIPGVHYLTVVHCCGPKDRSRWSMVSNADESFQGKRHNILSNIRTQTFSTVFATESG